MREKKIYDKDGIKITRTSEGTVRIEQSDKVLFLNGQSIVLESKDNEFSFKRNGNHMIIK